MKTYLHHWESCDVSLVHKDWINTGHVRETVHHDNAIVTPGYHLVTMATEDADGLGVGRDRETEQAIVTNQIQGSIHVTRDHTT